MSDWTPPPIPELPLPPGASTPEPPPHWGFRDILLFVALILPSLALSAFFVQLLFTLSPPPQPEPGLRLLAVQFVLYLLWLLGLYFVVAFRYQRPFWRSLAWVQGAISLPAAALLGVLAAGATILFGILLKAPPTDQLPISELLKSRLSMILVAFLAVTLGPLFEELTFRGFLLPVLRQTFGAPLGILLAALPFSLLHGPQYGWAWQQILMIVLVGCAFGWMRVRSGSTLAACFMHAGYNLVFTVLLLSGVREIDI